MPREKLSTLLLEQSRDLIWMINPNLKLVYANNAYLDFMANVTGTKKKLNESVFVEDFGEEYIDKWKAYYSRALDGETFEIEEHFYHPETKETLYSQIVFNPLVDENEEIVAVACQSREISNLVKFRSNVDSLMDASLDVFCTINEEGNFVFVSEAATKLWGYTPDELKHIPYKSLILEEDLPKTDAIAADIISGIEIRTFINRYRRKDGGIVYNLWSARWDDTAKLMYCVARDGKEQVEKEQIILQSEQRFKALVQDGADMISIIDSNGKYQYTSPTTTSILGITPEEFQGNTIFDFIHLEDQEKALWYMNRILNEKKVTVEPFRLRDSTGQWRWIETVLTNMLGNPAVSGIVANSRDITENMNLFKEIEASEQFSKIVIESNPDCFKILDIEGRLLYMNFNGLCQMEIADFSEFKNKEWWLLWGPENEKLVRESVYKALAGETVFFSAFCPTAKGTPKWWDVTVSPVSKQGEPIQKIISVSRDVTEQKNKELENELISKISSTFSLENDFEKATKKLCESIGLYAKLDWVELWTANLEKSEMKLISHYVLAPEDEIFYHSEASHKKKSKNDGLIGKVWVSEKQILWEDITKSKKFVRANSAKRIGLKSVLGIPLIFNNEVLGVLAVGVKLNTGYLQNYTQIFQRLEKFIGSELQRKILENDLSYLFDAIPDVISIGDFHGRFLRINKSGCELLGYTEEEVLQQNFEKFIHPEDLNICYRELQQLQNEKDTFGFEARFITKSGEILWLSWYCKSNIKEGLIYSTAKNITEEKKLRELNRQTRNLAKIGSWEVDLLNQSIYWTDEVHQMHETDASSFKPNLKQAIDFYREDFQELVKQSIEKSITNGEPFDFEAVLVTAKKKELWVRAIGNAEIVEGKCTRIYGSFQDINDRKEAELRLQSLADNLPGVVFQYYIYTDGTDALKYVTKGAKEVWGFTVEEVLENNKLVWNQIAAGGQIEQVQKSITSSIESKKNWNSRWKYILPNGEERTHLGLGSPNFMADGTIIFNSVILDMSQEVKNEEFLDEVSKIAKIGTWEADLVGGNHYKSPMIDEILELEANQPVPMMEDAIEFCRIDYRDKMQALFMDCMALGEPFDFEVVIVTANKKEKWVRIIGAPRIHEGSCTKIIGSLQDISSLKETETRLQAISNNLPGVVYQYLIYPDGTDELRYVSGAVEQLWGFSVEQVLNNINLVWDQIKAGGRFEEAQISIAKSIETQSKWTTTIKYMKPDGEFRTHLGNGMPVFLADGTIMFNSIILDITQEAKNEQILEQTTKVAKIGSWEMNLSNQYEDSMYWSPMVFEILELDSTFNPSYSGGLELHIGESKTQIQQVMDALIKEGKEFDEEVQVKTGKGNEKWVRVIGRCEWVNDEIIKIYGSFQDINEKKLAEEQRNSLLTTLENSLNEIYIFDAETLIFNYVNKGALLNIGYSENEIMGLTPLDIKPEYTATSFNQLVSPLKTKEKEKLIFFTNHKRKNGTFYPVEVHLQFIEEGNNKRFLAVTLDITERKKAEEKLLNAYEEKNNILESIGDAFFAVDKSWIVTYWNKEAEKVLGTKREEIVGENLWEIYADAIELDFYRQYHKAMETGESVLFEEYYPKLEKWFEVSAYPSEDGLSVYFKDVTLRKEGDIRLVQANERFEKVTLATSDAIWDWDILNDTYYRSQNIQKFFGKCSSTKLETKDFWTDTFHAGDIEEVKRSLSNALQDPKVNRWEAEYRVFNESDSVIYVIDRGLIIRDASGKAIRMIGAMSDITKSKTQEQELLSLNKSLLIYAKDLERSNEELEQFAFITSHDLQEPLRMISSFMDLLKRKYGDQLDEKGLQYIHFATDGAKRMKQIILDLLDYSRAGRPTEAIERVDLNELVNEYKQLRRKIISEKLATISTSDLPVINSYKAAITQVLHSLLDNAMKYSKQGVNPEIQISAVDRKNEWEFAVKDNGIGIDSEFHDKIFIIFQRLHNRNEYDGTGIGLSIAKKHVEFIGGKIWLESELGEGSTFYFTIPKT